MVSIQRVADNNIVDAGLVYSKSWQASHKGIVTDEFLVTHTPEYKTIFLEHEIKNSYNEIYLLYDDNIPMGIVCLNIELGEIKSIYISPEFWGKGHGSQLMDFAVEKLKHFKSVFLIVMNKNLKARKFYEKCGFIYTGEEKILSNEKEISELKYAYAIV